MVVPPDRLTPLQRALLDWWEAEGRHDLPWRRTRDPWGVLVSELMLQQTQVARVAVRWPAFLERFPTPAACAEAGVAEVVRAWAGLGYNRRAVNLHRSAVALVERHGGRVPEGLRDLLALPGVGPYTAHAVLVFAFGRDLGLVDTTAGRVVARALAGRAPSRKEAQAVADAAVPAGHAWAWGQAVFDLGAMVCTRRRPACDRCPVVAWCAWARAGWPAPDPVEGAAGVSRGQSPYAGSFRQGRGRLVDAIRLGPVPVSAVPAVAGWPDRAALAVRAANSLVADGLARWSEDGLTLP